VGIQCEAFIYRSYCERREDERRSACELTREYYIAISVFVCFMTFSQLVPIVSLKNFVQLISFMSKDRSLREVETEVLCTYMLDKCPSW
jgi:hypothetical protein